MLKQGLASLADFLRISAVRRLFALVEVKRSEIVGLISLAVTYALLEGAGLSLLLPVLQYAEDGPSSLASSGGIIWTALQRVADAIGIPINLVTLLTLAFVPILLRQVVFYINARYAAAVSNRVTTRMRVATFAKMMDADLEFFSRRPVGDTASVVLTQTGSAGVTVLNVIRSLGLLLLVTIYVLILLVVSTPLTIVTIAFAILVSIVSRSSIKATSLPGRQLVAATQHAWVTVFEKLVMVRLVKMRAQEPEETERVAAHASEMADANVRMAKLGALVEVTADPLLMLSAFLTIYLGIAVMDLRLASLGLLLFVLTRLNAKVKEFNVIRQQIAGGVSSVEIVRTVTREAIDSDTIRGGDLVFSGLREAIELRDVTYAYEDSAESALKGISVTLPAGSLTALVGRSGAGKSTMVELLPRLKQPTSGTILLDGVDSREFSLPSLRRGIGYLTQDPLLFSGTARHNLVYGLGRAVSDDELHDVLGRAHAEFILDLPDGLETQVGERGARLSGGERQRLALARVLLEQPSILVLDEPTSALDSESERYVQDALVRLHGRVTIVVIAHRLATVVAADNILVMADGAIVETGRHDELAVAGGPYQHLFESQLLRME